MTDPFEEEFDKIDAP